MHFSVTHLVKTKSLIIIRGLIPKHHTVVYSSLSRADSRDYKQADRQTDGRTDGRT